MNAVEAVKKWAETHSLGHWVSPGQIREIIGGTENADQWQTDEDLTILRDAVASVIRISKVKQIKESMDAMTSLLNRSETDTLIEGMMGQHPYLLNDLIWALLKATKQQCGRNRNWDGRISPALRNFIDEFIV